jgi:membrane protease YdiL (CAAX protease family)
MGRYFRRGRVEFLGYPVTPLTGFGLEVLLAGVLVTANAVWEELSYRGLGLQVNGTVYSSLSFGFAHLTNMLVPGVTVEDTVLQTLFATAFGFYAADRVQRREDGLERMIALHFWNNLLSLVLSYLADPESEQVFIISLRV